nr:hypothetical protein [Streptomyces sp. CWNU-1]
MSHLTGRDAAFGEPGFHVAGAVEDDAPAHGDVRGALEGMCGAPASESGGIDAEEAGEFPGEYQVPDSGASGSV